MGGLDLVVVLFFISAVVACIVFVWEHGLAQNEISVQKMLNESSARYGIQNVFYKKHSNHERFLLTSENIVSMVDEALGGTGCLDNRLSESAIDVVVVVLFGT